MFESNYSSCTTTSQQWWRRSLASKERQDETQFTTKIDGKTSMGPSYVEQEHCLIMYLRGLNKMQKFKDEKMKQKYIPGSLSFLISLSNFHLLFFRCSLFFTKQKWEHIYKKNYLVHFLSFYFNFMNYDFFS
jgi:hypothetical protein